MAQLPKKEEPKNLTALNFGWTMAGEFLFCFFVGYFADQKLATGYRWTLTGIGCGVLLIVYELWKILRNNNTLNQK